MTSFRLGSCGAPADAGGRVLAGAARAGEPITDVRLTGPDAAERLTGRPGDAAVPIRLADPEVARLLGPGSWSTSSRPLRTATGPSCWRPMLPS